MAETAAESVVIRCPACGAENRVRRDRLDAGMQAVCARCKAALPIASGPAVVTDATFPDLVERSPIPVLVDLWAPWCGPCRVIAPTIDELAAEMAGRVRVAKLNIDENQATAARFGVASIPTLLVFKGGREVDRIIGLQSKAAITGRLARVLG